MKTKINGYEIEGTPEEIIELMQKTEKKKEPEKKRNNDVTRKMKDPFASGIPMRIQRKQLRKKTVKTRTYWSKEEEKHLETIYKNLFNVKTGRLQNNAIEQIAKNLKKTKKAVQNRISKLNLQRKTIYDLEE